MEASRIVMQMVAILRDHPEQTHVIRDMCLKFWDRESERIGWTAFEPEDASAFFDHMMDHTAADVVMVEHRTYGFGQTRSFKRYGLTVCRTDKYPGPLYFDIHLVVNHDGPN